MAKPKMMSRAVLLVASFCLTAGIRVHSGPDKTNLAHRGAEAEVPMSDLESLKINTSLTGIDDSAGGDFILDLELERGNMTVGKTLFETWATCTWGVTKTTTSTKELTKTCFLSEDTSELGKLGEVSNVFIVDFAGDKDVWSGPTFGGYESPQNLPISATLGDVKINYEHWMAQLPESMTVEKLNVPGSHDAVCVSDGSGGAADKIATTQTKTLTQQLNAGFRWFDLRFAKKEGKWTAIHPNGAFKKGYVCKKASKWYMSAEIYINEVSTWLESHAEEIVFLRIKPACGDDDALLKEIESFFGKDSIYKRPSEEPRLADQKIKHMRGKIVPLLYMEEANAPFWTYTLQYNGKASLQKSYKATLEGQKKNKAKWDKAKTIEQS